MSPWNLLGWLLLAILCAVVGLRLLIVVLAVLEREWPAYKARRKHKRAKAGKVTCEFIGWENEYLPGQEDVRQYDRKYERVKVTCARAATHSTGRTWRTYLCEEHAKTRRGTADHPQPLNRPEPQHKTRVVGAAMSAVETVTWEFYDNFTAFPYLTVNRTDRHIVAEVVVTEACPDGGCVGEFKISWHDLSSGYYPRLNVFSDAWGTLERSGVIGILRGLERPTPEEVMQRLQAAGYTDKTPALSDGADVCPTCNSGSFSGSPNIRRARQQMARSLTDRQRQHAVPRPLEPASSGSLSSAAETPRTEEPT